MTSEQKTSSVDQAKQKQMSRYQLSSPRKTLARLFAYFRYDKTSLFLGIILLIISSVFTVLIDGMLSPIIDSLVTDHDPLKLAKYLLVYAGIAVVLVGCQYYGNFLMTRLAQRIIHRIRTDLFEHMQKLSIGFFDSHTTGDLMSTYTNDIDILNMALEQSVSQVVISIITVLGTFTAMFLLSLQLTLIVIAMLVVMFLVIRLVGTYSSRFYRNQQGSIAAINGYIEEMMSGQKVIKVFNHEKAVIEDFEVVNQDLRKNATAAAALGVVLMPLMGNLSFINYALIAMAGGIMAIKGTMTIGNIAAFLQYSRSFSRPITQISNQLNSILAALAGCERIFALMDQEPEIDEGQVILERRADGDFWRVPKEDGAFDAVPVCGDVRFDNVHFSYVPGKEILKGISLFAKPGQRLALVGSTGAGKTTITNLINRFYEIDSGTITMDGIDIRLIKKHDLREVISIVLQDVELFSATVYDNIRYGRLDATNEEVVIAAKLANADGFIRQLPNSYATYLKDAGANLSQGERQLLSIARAAIADPHVLILDEATSSIDTHTEQLINLGMDSIMANRTTFAIAHRLSTIRNSNAIMVMEQGQIIERGPHDDLMALKGRYYQLNTGQVELT